MPLNGNSWPRGAYGLFLLFGAILRQFTINQRQLTEVLKKFQIVSKSKVWSPQNAALTLGPRLIRNCGPLMANLNLYHKKNNSLKFNHFYSGRYELCVINLNILQHRSQIFRLYDLGHVPLDVPSNSVYE